MEFKKYDNSNSGVTAYEIEKDAINVAFDDMVYRYSHKKPGKSHVENMKKLARRGNGLSTYISQNIKDDYEDKYPINTEGND